jgi:outer membrane receptor for ferrienterochelin and colicin
MNFNSCKMKIKHTYRIFLVLLTLALSLSKAHSQPDTTRLENMSLQALLNVKVSTASKTLQELGIAPATVLVITKEQIRIRGYQSLLDLMYDLPGVKIDDKIYPGIRNSFTVRGIQGSEKFVILLDGITISSSSGEALPIMENYPVNLAEQVEVVFGPASALYGANAVSGIINIITKKGSAGKDFQMEASSATGTYGYSNSTLYITQKISDQVRLVVSGQYSYDKQPDYSKLFKNDSLLSATPYQTGVFNTIYGPAIAAKPLTSKYQAPMEAYNIYASLQSKDFAFSFFRNYSRTPSAFANNTNNAIYNKDVFIGQDVTMANAAYRKTIGKLSFSTSLGANQYNLDPNSNYRNLYTGMERAYKYSTCSMIKAEEQLDYKASNNFSMTIGAGYENYSAIPQSADLATPVNKKDYLEGSYLGTESYYRPEGLAAQFYCIKYHNAGAYLQAQYNPGPKIYFTLGARYDENSRYGKTFNPRLGVVYKLSGKTTLKALYGTAYLAPSPSDSYVQYGSFDTPDSGKTYHSYFLHLPNPGLKPIISRNAEFSINHYLFSDFSITLDAFYTELSGLHDFADDNNSTHLYNNKFNGIPVDYIEVFINQNKQINYGGSLCLNWRKEIGVIKMNSSVAVSYVNGKDEDGGAFASKNKQRDFIAPFMIHIGSDIKAGRFTAAPRLIIMGKQNLPGIGDTSGSIIKRQTIPGYALLNLSLRYTLKKGFSFFTNLSNLLNQDYRSVGFNMDLNNKNTELFYGQREEPLRIMGGFSYTF